MSNVRVIKGLVSVLVASIMTVVGFSSSAIAADIDIWQSEVGQAIAKKQVYPRAALRKEIEGKVKVEINIDRDGNIVAHSLKSSSGHEVLDREIPKLIKRVSPLPKPPADAKQNELTMVIPLAWTLQ